VPAAQAPSFGNPLEEIAERGIGHRAIRLKTAAGDHERRADYVARWPRLGQFAHKPGFSDACRPGKQDHLSLTHSRALL